MTPVLDAPRLHCTVVVSTPSIFAEVLCSTEDLRAALHAIEVFLLFAPLAHCALYVFDRTNAVVLSVDAGHWRVLVDDPVAARLERAS